MSEDLFVWDTTGLLYAQACDRLDGLLDAAGLERRHLVPSVVMKELHRLGRSPSHERLEVGDLGELNEISTLAEWMMRLGSTGPDGRDSGEAWVAALAEVRSAVAIIDDRRARQVIRAHSPDLEVHGVLWAISRGVVEGRVTTPQAYSGLCDRMLSAHEGTDFGALRWPFSAGGYAEWYEAERRSGNL